MLEPKMKDYLKYTERGATVVVTLLGRALNDEPTIREIGYDLDSLVDDHARSLVVIDFSRVKFLSSSALMIFIGLSKRIKAVKGKLILCGIDKNIYAAFKTTRLHKYFKIVADEVEALTLLSKGL